MAHFDVYIGKLDDPEFSWGGEGREGSPPKRLSPFFPPTRGRSGGYPGGAFGDLLDAIDKGHLEGRQVDWGSWVAEATKEEISSFVNDLYADDTSYQTGGSLPHLVESLEELRKYVAGLEDEKSYALVASEL